MKIRPVGAELFHADEQTGVQTDRQTDTTKLIDAFQNFAEAPKKLEYCLQRRPREVNIFMYFPLTPLEAGLSISTSRFSFNPLNTELNPICQ